MMQPLPIGATIGEYPLLKSGKNLAKTPRIQLRPNMAYLAVYSRLSMETVSFCQQQVFAWGGRFTMIFVHVITGRVRSPMEDQIGHITLLSMQALVFVTIAVLANL